jgi:hypothetical protein
MLKEQPHLSQNDQQTILDYSNDFAEGKEFEGTITGITGFGRLEIFLQSGQNVSYDLKEISFLEKI